MTPDEVRLIVREEIAAHAREVYGPLLEDVGGVTNYRSMFRQQLDNLPRQIDALAEHSDQIAQDEHRVTEAPQDRGLTTDLADKSRPSFSERIEDEGYSGVGHGRHRAASEPLAATGSP